MVGKKVLAIITGGIIMIGSCYATETLPFLSSKDVYDCIESLGSDQEQNITTVKQRIEATKTHFIEKEIFPLTPQDFIPGEIEWRKARLVEALYIIKNCFGGLEIPLVCLNKIAEICSLPENVIKPEEVVEVKDKNFRYARYLLMSQCRKYNESTNIYEFAGGHSMVMFSEAIGMLKSATNGDKIKSETLLASLKESGKFKGFLG